MGEDGSGGGFARSLQSLKPPPDRLYGRGRGHALRPRQQRLLVEILPQLSFRLDQVTDPLAAFPTRPAMLWLEVGFGSGEHALGQTVAHPEAGLIACEVYDNGICALLSRLVPEGAEADMPLPQNLRIWPGDARELLKLLPDAALDRLFLLFPDPWPKARHAKRRFVHPALVPLIARVLKPGAEWRVATDDPIYKSWVGEVMAAQDLFETAAVSDMRPEGWPPTRYEVKALREGRLPRYWRFLRRGRSPWTGH